MVRTQLYLPEDLYKNVRLKAQKKKMTFAAYVRDMLENDVEFEKKKKTLQEKYPFIGMFKAGGNLTNEEIDKAVYGL